MPDDKGSFVWKTKTSIQPHDHLSNVTHFNVISLTAEIL